MSKSLKSLNLPKGQNQILGPAFIGTFNSHSNPQSLDKHVGRFQSAHSYDASTYSRLDRALFIPVVTGFQKDS